MPPVVFVVLNAIQAAIQAAPQVEAIITAGKRWIDALFTAKLITKEQQKQLKERVDVIVEHFQNEDTIPPAWTVEPDPETEEDEEEDDSK